MVSPIFFIERNSIKFQQSSRQGEMRMKKIMEIDVRGRRDERGIER